MGTPISYGLINPNGTACLTAVPAFLVFHTRAGVARTPVNPVHLGGGQYESPVTDADEAAGTAWVIDNGVGPLPRYVFGSSSDASHPFLTFLSQSSAGALLSGSPPTIGLYVDGGAQARTPPSVVGVPGFGYAYTISPSLADVQIGTTCRVDGASGTLPVFLTETFYNPTAVEQPAAAPFTDASQEDAIREWVMAGAGLDSDHVLWAEQTGARKLDGAAWASVRLGAETPVAAFDEVSQTTDASRDPGTEIELRVEGLRSLAVSVQFFGPATVGTSTPRALAIRAQLALALPSVRTALADAGLTPYDNGQVTNVTALKGTAFEGRGLLALRFYVRRTVSEYTGYIAHCSPVSYLGPPGLGTANAIDI